jgi:hypothetical protein
MLSDPTATSGAEVPDPATATVFSYPQFSLFTEIRKTVFLFFCFDVFTICATTRIRTFLQLYRGSRNRRAGAGVHLSCCVPTDQNQPGALRLVYLIGISRSERGKGAYVTLFFSARQSRFLMKQGSGETLPLASVPALWVHGEALADAKMTGCVNPSWP